MKSALASTTSFENEPNSFVYMAAHDLRSPLMSIKGLIYLMQLESEKENLTNYFGLLDKSVDRMDKAISDIIVRSQSEEKEGDDQVMDVNEMVEECIRDLQYMVSAKSIRISLECENVGLCFSNRKKLVSIVSNIISNAIRYQDEGKDSFLRIKVSFVDKHYQFVFEDNGIGIADDMVEKVFDKYFLLNRSKGGTGLGLFMVKSSVASLGGKIHLKSRLGSGTTFTVQIPHSLHR